MRIKIEPLSERHDRKSFFCGERDLDDYFHRRAGQDEKRDISRVFVAVAEDLAILGFYTLSMCAIDAGELPKEIVRKLPRYNTIPAALIGRLARDLRARGQGVGELLLTDALKRVLLAEREVAVWAILVDAKNQRAADFYKGFAFTPFPSRPSRLFITMATVRKNYAIATKD